VQGQETAVRPRVYAPTCSTFCWNAALPPTATSTRPFQSPSVWSHFSPHSPFVPEMLVMQSARRRQLRGVPTRIDHPA
jgi:hypothetical protein